MSVEFIDCMGSDLTVVNAARVSFAKVHTEMDASDEKLVAYLAKHNHMSPFFHPQIQLRIKMPIFVAREWYRHTVGFSRNEVSRRYVSDEPECWIPSEEDLREKDAKVKQGSRDNAVSNAEELRAEVTAFTNTAVTLYNRLLEQKVAPEIARTVLPQSMYTEFVETASLAAYARLYSMRTNPDAQKEIRWFANEIGKIMEVKFPVSWKALAKAN
jgi:thymidylate synthase (FAD)